MHCLVLNDIKLKTKIWIFKSKYLKDYNTHSDLQSIFVIFKY